ncbi:MAG: glycosyltransferase family 2 protein [Halosimplex sp.]
MYKQHTVGVVVPAYNESGNVGDVIETMPAFVDRTYVVDDRSTDGTWAEIERAAARVNARTAGPQTQPRGDGGSIAIDPPARSNPVVPIRHDENRGVGGAIKTGYRYAIADGIDVAAVMAGDGQMDPALLDRILDPVVDGRAGYSKGDRLSDTRSISEMPPLRAFGSMLLTALTRISSGYWALSDPQNGYTAVDLDVFDEVDLDALHDDFGFCNDLLVRLNVADIPIADVPMRARYGDEESSIRYSRFVPNLSRLLLRDFLWRLEVTYLHTGDPFALSLAAGLGCLPVGVADFVGDRINGREEAGTRAGVLLATGVLAVCLSFSFDRYRNTDLVWKAPRSDDGDHE